MSDYTIAHLSATNRARCARWHNDYPGFGHGEWTVAHWTNAVCGEAGELANVAKKLERLRFMGAVSARDADTLGTDDVALAAKRLFDQLADEVADVVLYADLVLGDHGFDLAAAIARKFNEVSEREGFPERLP